MTAAVFLKLVAIFIVVAIGWLAGRSRFFGGGDAARALSNAAFYLFAPCLLFRTTARLDFATMPWSAIVAYFVPAVGFMLAVYAWRRRMAGASTGSPAEPAVRAVTVTFGNLAQLGIPMATALFDETGLSIHLSIVSVHALTLLSILTVLVELDVARAAAQAQPGHPGLARTLRMTVRNTLIHPIVLPVLAGMAWNLTGWSIPDAVDETLQMLGQAVIPVCLIAIGMSLAHYGVRGGLRSAFGLAAAKLLALPLMVLLVSRYAFGLSGLPLTVMVMCAAMPSGTNVIMFAQRYHTLEAETTTAMVLSTLAFALTAPFWLWLLHGM